MILKHKLHTVIGDVIKFLPNLFLYSIFTLKLLNNRKSAAARAKTETVRSRLWSEGVKNQMEAPPHVFTNSFIYSMF